MIRMKIAFVLRLIDDFTGKPIREKGIRFIIGGRAVHPLEKEDGMYVFLEPRETLTKVFIESTGYYTCSVLIDKRLLDTQEPVAEIRLYEKAGKSFSSAVGILSGKIEKKLQFPVEVYAKKSSPLGLNFKDYQNIEGEFWIQFSGFTKENILGKTWVLDDAKHPVLLILEEKRGINEYRAEIIRGEPEKIRSGTPLVRIYRSVTDTSGNYAIPVESDEENQITEVETLHDNKKTKEED